MTASAWLLIFLTGLRPSGKRLASTMTFLAGWFKGVLGVFSKGIPYCTHDLHVHTIEK